MKTIKCEEEIGKAKDRDVIAGRAEETHDPKHAHLLPIGGQVGSREDFFEIVRLMWTTDLLLCIKGE